VSWSVFRSAEPDLAGAVEARFAAARHHVMATLRRDGSPRLSGTNVFIGDEIRLGMMAGTRRAADLRRDPRCGLHSAPDDEILSSGDARVDCVAREMTPTEAGAWFATLDAGHDTGDAFVLLIERVTLTTVDEGRLIVETWSPSAGRISRHRQ
jgi:hypothetical protein